MSFRKEFLKFSFAKKRKIQVDLKFHHFLHFFLEKSNYESIIQQQSIIEKNNNSFFDNYFRMEEQK